MKNAEWRLWLTQIAAIMRIEVRRNFFSRRAIPVYLLASMPVILFAGHALMPKFCTGSEDLMVFAGVFQILVLRLCIFFGAVAIFVKLFRGEVLEKSLHYWLLAPVRREVLVIGKYLSGLVAAITVFGASTAISYVILCQHLAATKSRELAGPALNQLPAYLGVTALACAGYGAVFLMMGMYLRNPIIPATAVLLWESFIVFLPPVLKKISVIFYLESLCPVSVPFKGPGALFAMTADPTPPWLAIPGLVGLTAILTLLASLRMRRVEISYGAE